MNTTPTPGYKTTEFWLTLLANLVLAASSYLQTIDATWAVVAVTILNSIYALSRMGTKAASERTKKAIADAHATIAKTGDAIKKSAPLLLVSLIAGMMIPSCATFGNPALKGELFYEDAQTGAKAGLSVQDGRTRAWGRYPVRNKDTGEITGYIRAESPSVDIIKDPTQDTDEVTITTVE